MEGNCDGRGFVGCLLLSRGELVVVREAAVLHNPVWREAPGYNYTTRCRRRSYKSSQRPSQPHILYPHHGNEEKIPSSSQLYDILLTPFREITCS